MNEKNHYTTKRAVILSRVSTVLQTEEHGGTGIEFQENKLNQYATLYEMDIVGKISDVASGGLSTRDGIQELERLVADGLVDVVLIWNVSRAFRSMVHFTTFYEFLNKHKVELVSVSEGIRSSTKTGKMMFGVLCSLAEFEKSVISERMMSGKITKARSGSRKFGGKIPFGYKKSDDGEIEVDSTNSEIVKYIFKKTNSLLKRPYLTKRKRTSTLLKYLDDRGFTYNGKRFKGWNIRDILNNKFYMGELTYGEIKTKHQYEPIISKRLYNQIQAVS